MIADYSTEIKIVIFQSICVCRGDNKDSRQIAGESQQKLMNIWFNFCQLVIQNLTVDLSWAFVVKINDGLEHNIHMMKSTSSMNANRRF